jgi:hypothetical protein
MVRINQIEGEVSCPERMSGFVVEPLGHELIEFYVLMSRRVIFDNEVHYSLLLRRDRPYELGPIEIDSNTITGYAGVDGQPGDERSPGTG